MGKDLRRRTAYLLNDDILIDFGPDAYWQVIQFEIDLLKIDAIFYTHSHSDHCNPVELLWHRKGYSQVSRTRDIFGNQTTLNKIKNIFEFGNWETYGLVPHLAIPNKPINYKNYVITPILAQHATYPEIPLNYIIQDDKGKTALIGNDSGWWCDVTWNTIAQFKLDIAILEGTMGPKYADHSRGHLGTNAVVKVRDRLKEIGAVDNNTTVVVNHFSHNGLGLHDEHEQFFNPLGIQVGYDGLDIEK